MIKFAIVGISLLALSACDNIYDCNTVVDQSKRETYFNQCLEKLPKGPDSTVYNDWSEVVSECASNSYRMSIDSVGKDCHVLTKR